MEERRLLLTADIEPRDRLLRRSLRFLLAHGALWGAFPGFPSFDRNIRNKEKGVDVEMAMDIADLLHAYFGVPLDRMHQPGVWTLEYGEPGEYGLAHEFRAEGEFSLDQVKESFLAYVRGDESWHHGRRWSPLDSWDYKR